MAQTGFVTRKRRMVLNYLEEKPEVFKLQQVVFPQIVFETLVEEIAQSCGVGMAQTQAVVSALLNRLVHYMQIGHAVNLGSFGTFKPTFRSKCATHLEKLSVDNITLKYIRFIPGKKFKNMLANMNVEDSDALSDVE